MDLIVLLNLDEIFYEGGINGENYFIVWYYEFDGGCVWYIGLGYILEFFSDFLFLDYLLGGINYVVGLVERLDFSNVNVVLEENWFIKVVLED